MYSGIIDNHFVGSLLHLGMYLKDVVRDLCDFWQGVTEDVLEPENDL